MKNNEVISVKIKTETKEKLQEIAKEKEWTISHLARKIIEEYIEKYR